MFVACTSLSQVAQQGEVVKGLKAGGGDKEAIAAEVKKLLELKEMLKVSE